MEEVKKKKNIVFKLLDKFKSQLVDDEIKMEINNTILKPLYNDIYDRIFPHYITLLVLFIVIILLLLILILINIIRKN
jgi:ABC-type protease/lipase transport system fused ATPase/permease subunit